MNEPFPASGWTVRTCFTTQMRIDIVLDSTFRVLPCMLREYDIAHIASDKILIGQPYALAFFQPSVTLYRFPRRDCAFLRRKIPMKHFPLLPLLFLFSLLSGCVVTGKSS